jgi:hypothetical protein
MGVLLEFCRQLTRELLRRAAYGSLIGAALVWLLVTSSAWQAAGAAFSHADAAAAVAVGSIVDRGVRTRSVPAVVVVAIDDEVYRTRFDSKSPLDRSVLLEVAREILASTPKGTRLAVDLDVSPLVTGQRPPLTRDLDELDRLWLEHRDRVVLTRPLGPLHPATQEWIRTIEQGGCGVEFARAEVPEVFGLVDVGHDLAGSLASRAAAPRRSRCVDVSRSSDQMGSQSQSRLVRTALDPVLLAQPLTLPAQPGLGPLLRELQPAVVVLGGTWGTGDVFRTPFGERHGVHVHAAMAAGHLDGRMTVPPLLQVLAAIVAAALAVTTARAFAGRLAKAHPIRLHLPTIRGDQSSKLGGIDPSPSDTDKFALGSLRRMAVLAWLVVLLLLIFFAIAAINVFAGVWLPTMILIGFTVFSVSAAWVVDITRPLQVERAVFLSGDECRSPEAPGGAVLLCVDRSVATPPLRKEFVEPLGRLLAEVRSNASDLLVPGSRVGASRLTALRRLTLSVSHLLGKTGLPLGAMIYLLCR